MTARPRRTPSATGFKSVASPADIPIKKKFISKEPKNEVKEPTVLNADAPLSPVPKNFSFLSSVNLVDYSGLLSKITNSPYPTCCGAQILHGFSVLQVARSHADRVAMINAQVHAAIQCKVGMLIAIYNHTQKPTCAKAFEECGFKVVSTTSNPNHQDTTTIYLCVKVIGNKELGIDGKEKKLFAA